MASHELDYRILGESMQTVEIELDPGETVIAEAGAMNYMTGDIRFTARMGDGSTAACWASCGAPASASSVASRCS